MWISIRREDGKWKLVQRVLGVAVWRWEGDSWDECVIVMHGRFREFKTVASMERE